MGGGLSVVARAGCHAPAGVAASRRGPLDQVTAENRVNRRGALEQPAHAAHALDVGLEVELPCARPDRTSEGSVPFEGTRGIGPGYMG